MSTSVQEERVNISEYEDTNQEVKTPNNSADEDLDSTIRCKRGLTVSEFTNFIRFHWRASHRFHNREAFKDVVTKFVALNLHFITSNMKRQHWLEIQCDKWCSFRKWALWDLRRAI